MTPNAPKHGEAETILVVEDEIMVRMLICDYLRQCGYRVIEAASADEAVVVLQQAEPVIDLVLSDTEMPGAMDGFGLAQWVRENKPGLTVILVGSPARAAAVAGELCESGPMLAKPYDPQILLNRIRRLLARPGSTEDRTLPHPARPV
jgi:DNA-binding response OmpR family regulator